MPIGGHLAFEKSKLSDRIKKRFANVLTDKTCKIRRLNMLITK